MQSLHFESGHRIIPLIEADETFAAIERAIADAEQEVFMAYWTLAPYLGLVTDQQDDWIDLLTRAAQRGVRFHILLADFDPVFTLPLHRDAWRTFHRLRTIAEDPGVAPGTMQAICSRNLALPNLAERLVSHAAAQFLREARVVDWIIGAAERHPDLEVVVLLPIAPERLDPDGDWNVATRHGHWLQLRNLRRLQGAVADRFGAFTLLSRQKEGPDDHQEDIGLGARSVYVHAKAIIVDDKVAMIGSANLNGRSFSLDTETALVWREAAGVRAFRERLWRHHLADMLPDGFDPMNASGLTLWNLASARNRVARTADRPGFAVALEMDWARANTRRCRLIRNRFV